MRRHRPTWAQNQIGLLDRPQSCGIPPPRDDFSQHYATLTMVVMARLLGEFREASSGEHEAASPIPSLDPRRIRVTADNAGPTTRARCASARWARCRLSTESRAA